MANTSPSDRVQVRSRGELMHPGACALCGSGTCDDGYVDVGVYYDYEGQVYFCMRCSIQIAEAIDCLTPGESEYLKAQNESLVKTLAETQEKLDAANTRLTAFDVALAGSGIGGVLSVSSEASVEGAPDNEAPADEPANRGESEEPVAAKPVKKRRPNDAEQPPVRDRNFTI